MGRDRPAARTSSGGAAVSTIVDTTSADIWEVNQASHHYLHVIQSWGGGANTPPRRCLRESLKIGNNRCRRFDKLLLMNVAMVAILTAQRLMVTLNLERLI